ncbi:MAG: extracellular solute-binding protein [Anaerolineae bacterium]|nr:extracellular solute-binding protein [Anaerolineae bacterium]
MKKNRLSVLLSILLIAAFVLAACAPAATPEQPAAEQPAAEQPAAEQPAAEQPAAEQPAAEPVTPAGTFPVVNEKTTLKVLIAASNGVSDYEENDYTKWLEEKTGLDLVFDVAPNNADEARQKLNLVLASGELPDVIINFNLPLDQQQVLADQGLIVPVDDLIEKYGDEYKKVLTDLPQIKEVSALSDGKMYAMVDINECYHCSLSQKAWIYKPWLDKLGLSVPTTTDELYTVLKAFKEQDPNGNGIADEIPWSASVTGDWHGNIDKFIMNSFVYNNDLSNDRYLYVEDGTVKAAFAQPGWKEGVTFLNKLYSEGLIDPEAFTNDATKLKALAENPDAPILGFTQEGWPGMFLDWGGASGRWTEYVPVAPLKGPSGDVWFPESPYSLIGNGKFVITSACENPAAAFRLADLMYNFEATLRNAIGRPGEEWDYSADGAESIDGGAAQYKVLVTYNEGEQKVSWNQAAPAYRSAAFRLAQEFNPDDPLERYLYNWSNELYAPAGKPDMQLPPLVFDSAQSQRLGELNTALYTLVDQMYASFITGEMDIASGWDSYLAELKNSGLDDFLAIYQAAYDAKYK